jgi:hypothetical protein
MSDRFDVPLDAILTPAPNAGPAINADEAGDLDAGGLLVVGRGDVVMGHPTQFDKAG